MPTIKQIADIAGVSPSTVSRVLNKDTTIVVSDEVREKIFSIAHRLQYLPPKQRKVETKFGITIGIADWHITKLGSENTRYDFYQNIARRLSNELVKIFTMKKDEDCKVDGIIAFGVFNKEEMIFLRKQSYNILFINSVHNDFNYDRIQIEYYSGLKDLINFFVSEKGHNKISYIGGIYEKEEIRIGFTRRNSLKTILSELNIFEEKYFHIGKLNRQSGYDMTTKAIKENTLRQAIIVGNEEMALGVLQSLTENNIEHSSKDIAVYRDIATTYCEFSKISTINMFPDYMWETALKMMMEKISGKRTQCYTVIMPTKLTLF